MSGSVIHFGTSGWRGIIAEDFTFANVRLAAAGIAQYLLAQKAKPRVIVGYDTRFMSEKFADAAAETLGSHGVECYVSTRPDPTPALSHEILHSRFDGGVNVEFNRANDSTKLIYVWGLSRGHLLIVIANLARCSQPGLDMLHYVVHLLPGRARFSDKDERGLVR